MTITRISVRKHLADITEWQKLGEANIFPPGSRLELIEVADSSLSFDQNEKLRLYARHNIA